MFVVKTYLLISSFSTLRINLSISVDSSLAFSLNSCIILLILKLRTPSRHFLQQIPQHPIVKKQNKTKILFLSLFIEKVFNLEIFLTDFLYLCPILNLSCLDTNSYCYAWSPINDEYKDTIISFSFSGYILPSLFHRHSTLFRLPVTDQHTQVFLLLCHSQWMNSQDYSRDSCY